MSTPLSGMVEVAVRPCAATLAASLHDQLQKVAAVCVDKTMTPMQQQAALAACVADAGATVQGVLSAYLSVLVAVAAEMLTVLDRTNLLSRKDNLETVSQSLPAFGSLRMQYGSMFQKLATRLSKATTDFRVRVYTDMRGMQHFTLAALSSRMRQLGFEGPSESVTGREFLTGSVSCETQCGQFQ